jgi:signal transduction histidine kinase
MNSTQTLIKNLSIKNKLTILGMVTSLVAILIICSGFIIFIAFEEKSEMIDEMKFIGKLLGEDLALDVTKLLKDNDAAKSESNLLHNLKYRDSIDLACIMSPSGQKIASYPPAAGDLCAKLPKINTSFDFIKNDNFKNNLVIKNNIRNSGQKIATLLLVANLKRIDNKIYRAMYCSIIFIFFVLVLSYAISKRLQKNVSDPILKLAAVSYAVKTGDYNIRATYQSNDEIGELTEAFNNMLNVIKNSKDYLENKVTERTKELEKAMEVKANFLSNMSHEIRIPIHGILNYADFLLNDWEIINDERKYEFIKKLYSNSKRLFSLINNLLDLSRLNANKMDFYFEKFDFIEVVKTAMRDLESLYLKKNIQVMIEYDTRENFEIIFDVNRISQVISNLLSNAIKFTNEGIIVARVKFLEQSNSKRRSLKFVLEDSGIGIPEDELLTIFDQFNQSSKTKNKSGGTGLGLAISKDIIGFHGGEIWAENKREGQGCVFKFVIPVSQNLGNNEKPQHNSFLYINQPEKEKN